MTNDKRLKRIQTLAASIAGEIQNYRDAKLKMQTDREDLYDSIDIDLAALTKTFKELEEDLDSFILGR